MNPSEEKHLLQRIKAEPHQFAVLYDNYYPKIFGYVYRRCGDYDLSKDITAETFLKAYQKIDVFEWRNISFGAWLYKIAGNELNMFYRKRKYSPACLEDLNIQLVQSPGIETERAAIEKAWQEHREFVSIQQQLKNMDIKYQEVIALRFFEEKQVREIAEILGKNEGTVKSLLSRGIEKLWTLVEISLQ